MKKKSEKTMKYRTRIGSQWLLISLMTASTILPGITATVTALTEETTVLENIDTNQENEAELLLENDDSTEELSVAQEDENDTDNSISSESMESFDGGESHRGETTVNEKLLETSKKSEITVKDANDIDSGTAGSVPWRIDSERTLHFGEGKLSENPSNVSTGFWAWRGSTVVKKIIFEGKVTTSGTLQSMFVGMSSVGQIENLDYLDTSNVTNMNEMFSGMSSLTELDVSSFDMSKVTQTNYLFKNTKQLSKLTLGKNFKFVVNSDLPSIGTSSGVYTGKWVNVASGTIENPYGTNIWSSTEFEANYKGITDADTYVWQKTGENVIVKYVDEINNSIVGIPEKIISGAIGEDYDASSAEWQISIPGYSLDQENLPKNMFGKFTNQTQEVVYSYIKDKTAINVHDSTLYVGDEWTAEKNFDSALDKDGNKVDFKDITVTGDVDTSKAGTYEVTYSYDGIESKATITVKDKQTAVNVHDSTLYVGDEWKAEKNFDSALDKDGNTIDFKDVTVTGEVDTSKAGMYDVTYSYDGIESKATITVKDKQTAVNVHDSNLYVGDEWKVENNFDSALDKDGNKVDFKDITVTGDVDISKAGTYEVTYSYDGIESKATITVKDKQTAVNVHDSNLYVGDEWTAENNFDSALDKDGESVEFKDITVTGDVDISKAGTYEVTYSYDGVESKATITVLEVEEGQDLAHIVVHDSELEVGEDWLPEDNFDEATSSDGEEEYFSDIIVSGTVDTKKPGTYEVTYSIPEEHWGRGLVEGHHTATAKIVVSEKENKDSGSKGEESNSDKDNLSNTDELSGENNTRNTKGLPTTGEHASALIFMIGIALLVLGSIFGVLRIKKNKK